ncbi:cysteine-rich repeat secretory protein 60 isoform X2 [Senna tora]|uniref:Cysteine-rich repeat secretory protein 60 isoform X2 n=1 Tax=Senna tora TaxID=362788 RepID=A0A834U2G3_9FABA|nr:cysteine-rich repeat secretory protein 60 isoform X2 [Senna tora]
MPDCSSCVSRSLARLPALCPGSCGAAIQLDACFIKYDNASFLGVQDKTLIFKKCGPSPSYGDGNTNNGHVDVEEGIMGMGSSNYKDDVLDGLAGSGGAFRVGGSGDVQGVAQCTGDLGFQECHDCIAEAIRRLRSDCGDAAYGDVFLGKCYARYSVGGAHGYSKAHGMFSGIKPDLIYLTFDY